MVCITYLHGRAYAEGMTVSSASHESYLLTRFFIIFPVALWTTP